MTCARRFTNGCAMRKQSFEGALCSLDAITDPTRETARSSRKVTPPQLMAQAHSLTAHAQYGSVLAQIYDITHSFGSPRPRSWTMSVLEQLLF